MSAFGNPLAPPWMGFTPVISGMQDQEWDVDLPTVLVPANSFVMGQILAIDSDADFLCAEIQTVISLVTVDTVPNTGTALPSDIRVRIRDGQGRLFTSDFVPISDLNGPLCPPWPLRRGSVLVIDYQNINQTASEIVSVVLLLKGWKRNQCANIAALNPPYTPMYRTYPKPQKGQEFEDFEYPFTFTQASAIDLLKIPLQTDNDADFWWCATSGDWNTANNDVATVGGLAVTFYDAIGLSMIQSPLINPWGSPVAGLFRESVFSSGGGRPAPHWPAIFIPRGGVVLIDMSFGQGGTLRFSLRGKKVYGACQ